MPERTSALADALGNYLTARQHTLSTAHLTGMVQLQAEAAYVLGEAQELKDAVEDLARIWDRVNDADRVKLLRGVRHEIADVALSDTALAGMLDQLLFIIAPWADRITVEGCIAEKTEADRSRG